ncbi:MAG: hypothetical protein HZY76_20010 [Anaerolineae bacterium]|nr:MAG: hypothetical protein HZY76_20010 [Anaerolineae bacterium]
MDKLNPMTGVVDGFRCALLDAAAPSPGRELREFYAILGERIIHEEIVQETKTGSPWGPILTVR